MSNKLSKLSYVHFQFLHVHELHLSDEKCSSLLKVEHLGIARMESFYEGRIKLHFSSICVMTISEICTGFFAIYVVCIAFYGRARLWNLTLLLREYIYVRSEQIAPRTVRIFRINGNP